MKDKIKVGVAVENWKLKHYQKAIEDAGFQVVDTAKYLAMSTIIVMVTENEASRLKKLLTDLQRKYSQRNRMN